MTTGIGADGMFTLVRYRLGQTLAVSVLAAVVIACATFAALYDRAVQQALVDVKLAQAPVQGAGLTLTFVDPLNSASARAGLVELVPDGARRMYHMPVSGARATASVLPDRGDPAPVGVIMSRDGFCDHVTLTAGRCADGSGEVVISEADVRTFGYKLGADVRVEGDRPTSDSAIPVGTLTVVGVYNQDSSEYWFGQTLTGVSGLTDQSSQQRVQHDAWLTPQATFESRDVPRLPEFAATVQMALNHPEVRVDELFYLTDTLSGVDARATELGAAVSTGLPDIAAAVAEQRDQARVTIPLLMTQLALLVLIVFWMVLETLTEQRRSEVAIALLQGRGRHGARRLLLKEMALAVLAGAVGGLLIGSGACFAATEWVLPGNAPVELRAPAAVAALSSLGCLILMCALAAWRVTRASVSSLLRSVGTRRSGWGFTPVETLVLVGSGTLVVAFVAGWLSGPAALAGPMLLALVVGLLLAHAIVPVATALGRRWMSRGHLVAGVGTLGVARGTATRRLVAILTVAVALITFAADAYAVGVRNRSAAAAQEVGARLVADVETSDLTTLREVLTGVDPSGVRATPVVRVRAPDPDAPQTLAVLPSGFAAVALFDATGADQPRWDTLAPREVPPIAITATDLAGVVDLSGLRTSASDPVTASVVLATSDGNQHVVPVSREGQRAGSDRFQIRVPCGQEEPCALTGFEFESRSSSMATGTIVIRDLITGHTTLDLGAGDDWYGPPASTSTDGTTSVADAEDPLTVTAGSEGLTVAVSSTAGNSIKLTHGWVPEALPAIWTAHTGPGSDATSSSVTSPRIIGLDGLARSVANAGEVATVPGAPAQVALVDLEFAMRGTALSSQAQTSVWFAADDSDLLAEVRSRLADAGIAVTAVRRLDDAERAQSQSLPSWSLQLAALLAASCLLVAGLVVVVVAGSTWRNRSHDLASMKMAGVSERTTRRVAVVEPVTAAAFAVVAGVLSGLVGAQVTLPEIPILASVPAAFSLTLSPAWGSVSVAVALTFAVLTIVAGSSGLWIAGRGTLSRVREMM